MEQRQQDVCTRFDCSCSADSKSEKKEYVFDALSLPERVKNLRRLKFISDPNVREDLEGFSRKTHSEENIKSNCDDLFGPCILSENPAAAKANVLFTPNLCTWKFISREDTRFLKENQSNKLKVQEFIGAKLPETISHRTINDRVFRCMAWETFTFARNNAFTDKQTSAILGLMFLTFTFLLTNPHRTMEEVYNFFYNGLLLHAVLDPPKMDEVFTLAQCEIILETFHKLFLENMILLRIACIPIYRPLPRLSD